MMLRVENLDTGYDKKQVLFDISFEIEKGDLALLIGSNGSGKSTLLKAIYGICKTWQGKVFFENEEITNAKPESLLKKGILYVPQKNNVFEQLTVKENLEISGMAIGDKSLYKQRLEIIVSHFPLLVANFRKFPMKMSGGERQQLVIAMAMLHQPKLLLIDEPFTGLAHKSIESVREQLQQLNKESGVTILLVEHRINEAIPITNHILALKLGKLEANFTEMYKFTSDLLNHIII